MKTFEDLNQIELTITRGGQRLLVSIFLMDELLIDTGPARSGDYLIPLFEEWTFENVVLTHHHEDHTGLAYWIDQYKKIPIHIHESGVDICEKNAKLPLYRHLFWGGRKAFKANVLPETLYTKNYSWDVIHTPGHADDHVALYNREKGWLFGGDLFVQPTPKSMFRFESVPETIHSLRKVLAYDFDIYICSHAGVIFDGKKALKKKLDYLMSQQQEILFLYNKGLTPKEIRKQLFPRRHPMHYFSLFENSPMHFIHSIIG